MRKEKLIQLLTIKEVCDALSIKKSSVWSWVKNGTFPEPIIIGEKNTRWIESEIQDYINSKKKSRPDDREKSLKIIMGKLQKSKLATNNV